MSVTLLPSCAADDRHSLFNAKNSVLPFCSLLDLDRYQPAMIDEIIDNPQFGQIDSVISQRLRDLGFLPNTIIHIIAKGLFGRPPYAVQLSTGAQFSLRADELIKIKCRALDLD